MNKDFYNKKDIPAFQEEVCKKTCILMGKCINENRNEHWFLMCPHYFNWKLDIKSFVMDQLEWERQHPEEAEAKHKELVERAKAWGDEQRRLKREAKKAEKDTKAAAEPKEKKTRKSIKKSK